MARPTTAARRYAEAAFELARRDGTEDAWAVALEAGAHALGSEEALRLVENPAIPFADRRRAVGLAIAGTSAKGLIDDLLARRRGLRDSIETVRQAATGPVATQVGNLATLLLERRRIGLLAAISTEYQRLLDAERGIVAATVTSAAPLSEADETAVRERVERMTGATVRLRSVVDESLIGGLTVQVGDRLLDASVRGRLERLRSQLVAGSRGTTTAG
jgi:F-type H+-transporting ATPase subunit delta